MVTPTRIEHRQLDALAQDLHRRQVVERLATLGLSVESGDAPGQFTLRDQEDRTARLTWVAEGGFRIEAPGRGAIVRWFDSEGRLVRLEDPGGLVVTTSTEADGTRRISREGHGDYAVSHDPFGVLTRVAYPDGSDVHFDSGESEAETVADQAGQVTRYHRDADGEVIAVTDRNGHRLEVTSGTRMGQPTLSVATAAGNIHTFGLSGAGELADWSVNGTPIARYRGTIGDLPQRADFADGHWVEFEAKDGRITAAHNPNGSVRLTHDESGLLLAEDQNGFLVSYERDRTGLLTSILLPDGDRIRFSYDASGRLSEAIDWSGAATRIEWAANGQIAGIEYPNGIATTVQSNALGLPEQIQTRSLRDGTSFSAMALSHDANDRVTEIADAGFTRRFRYDPVGRLVAVDASEPAFSEAWQLDAMGNRTRDGGTTWTVDRDNRIGAPDGVVAYDALGRTTTVDTPKGRAVLQYNGQGQLIRVILADGTVADYAYDGFGRRIAKRVNGKVTRFLWAGQTLLSEWTEGEAGGWRRRDHLFLPDLFLPVAMRVDGRIYRQHSDHRCAPFCLTDENGRPAWRGRLKAFGEAVISQASVGNPWRLVNQYADDETGLHYNLCRYFHPGLGRYLTPDPAFDKSAGGNLYLYAAGDPINQSDPTGEILPILAAVLIGAAVGAVIGAAVKAYETRDQPMSWGRAGQIGKAALLGGAIGGASAGLGFLAASSVAAAAGVTSLAKASIGVLMGIGAVDGAVSAVAQTCLEAKAYDKMVSGWDIAGSALIGAGLGAVTMGVGGLVSRRLAKRAEAELAEREAMAAKARLDSHYNAKAEAESYSGHGHDRHGAQTSMREQTQRVQTGEAPDGNRAPTAKATKFDTHEKEIEAVQKARAKNPGQGKPKLRADGKPNRDVVVVDDGPEGFGDGVEVQRLPNGEPVPGRPVQPTGRQPNARVIFEYNPKSDTWEPLTQFPTDDPVTP